MKTLIRVLSVVLVLVLVFGICTDAFASPPDHAGTNGPPPHARNGKAVKSDPDDNGRGPERGDGTADLEDFNNGCGNDEDRDDDNEGICGPHKEQPKVEPPTGGIETIPVVVKPTVSCKLQITGSVIELFPADWVPSMGERGLIAEALGELEYAIAKGDGITVFFWNSTVGHDDTLAEYYTITCQDGETITLAEKGATYGFKITPE